MVDGVRTVYTEPESDEEDWSDDGSEAEEDGGDYEETPVATRHTDNAGLAMFVSVILPGIGAVIAGNKKGLAVFALSVVAAAVAYTSFVLMPFSVSVMVVLWIVGLSMTVESTTIPEHGEPC